MIYYTGKIRLGYGVTVTHGTLTPVLLVRVQLSQPKKAVFKPPFFTQPRFCSLEKYGLQRKTGRNNICRFFIFLCGCSTDLFTNISVYIACHLNINVFAFCCYKQHFFIVVSLSVGGVTVSCCRAVGKRP